MRFIQVSIAFILLPVLAFSQDIPNLTINISGGKFEQVAREIERQANLKVYFRTSDVDSLVVNIDVTNSPLTAVLDKVFEGSSMRHVVHQQTLYITKSRDIFTSLPVDFYLTNSSPGGHENAAFDNTDYAGQNKAKASEGKLHFIGLRTADMRGEATLTGLVTDTKTGEAIVGASVFIEKTSTGVATDPFGHYTLTLPKGRHDLTIKSVGMVQATRKILLYGSGKLDVELAEEITPLKEVVVESERDVRVTGMEMGMDKLDIKAMKQMPLVLGETDIMKIVLTLPGVQSVGEGTAGLNVRGGTTSQNLILFNDAVVYNPSHMFGFFSTFNPDVLKDVELYKSGITAGYGGRLSSVMDVRVREGNLKKFSGSGGISPVTGRLTLEGPIIKEKASFLVGVRSTYSDWILKKLDSEKLRGSTASFHDVTGNITYNINDNNNITVNGYLSQDKFKLNSDTLYGYSDRNAVVKWKHNFSRQLYGVFTGSASKYSYDMSSEDNPTEAFGMNFSIAQANAKADLTWFFNPKHTLTGGFTSTWYSLVPGRVKSIGDESLVVPVDLQQERATENALYIGENYEINTRASIYAGLRYSFYNNLGPQDVYIYSEGEPRLKASITDTVHYSAGQSTAGYAGFEPRLSFRYLLTGSSSIKVSYNRQRQYIQMLSNTLAITPTDIWKLSDAYIPPQTGNQVSLGFYKNLKGNMIETSAEIYYKTSDNTIEYRNGAQLLLNPHLETDVILAHGKAYGIELMIKKAIGRLNGWISYTYSRSLLRTKSEFETETINDGEFFPSNYDKPNAVNLIGNYKISRRINFSLNGVYSTGRPITVPVVKYQISGSSRVFYSQRNQYRIPDYFRIDASINLEGNHKIKKLAHSSFTFAVYNLTGRRNAYSIFFTSEKGVIKGYKLSVFGQAIPTLTYNFKF